MKSPYPKKDFSVGDKVCVSAGGITAEIVSVTLNGKRKVYRIKWENGRVCPYPHLDQSIATKDWYKVEV